MRRWVLFAALSVLADILIGCGGGGGGTGSAGKVFQAAGSPLSAGALYDLGEAARTGGDLDGALGLYQSVVGQFPDSGFVDEAWLGIGNVHLAGEDYEAAREAYAKAAAVAGSDCVAKAGLAIGRAHVTEFEHLDSGTAGFVDASDPAEFLPNLEAIDTFQGLAQDDSLPAGTRLEARLELARALFRGRRFSEARTEFSKVLSESSDPLTVQAAHVESGLAFIEEANADGAIEAFEAAGAAESPPSAKDEATRLDQPGARDASKLGPFATPTLGFIDLSEIVILVHRTVSVTDTAAALRAKADLGVALAYAYVKNDLVRASQRLETLVGRSLAAPLGDLVRFQLADVRATSGNRDGAMRDYQALLSDFPASAFAQRAHQRIGELLFESFSQDAAAKAVIDGRLLANLEANLRAAVGTGSAPVRQARAGALNLLGRLDAEGIPIRLTIAEPNGLPHAHAGVAYRHELAAFGASGAVTWSQGSNSRLPVGLTLSGDGVLEGTPSEHGSGFVTLQATDQAGEVDSRLFFMIVEPFEVVTPPRLFDAFVGEPYSATLLAKGHGPFTFEAVQIRRVDQAGHAVQVRGFIPGLTLSPAGELAGSPTEPSGNEPFLLAVRVADGRGRKQVAFFSLFVAQRDLAKRGSEASLSRAPGESERSARAVGPASLPALGRRQPGESPPLPAESPSPSLLNPPRDQQSAGLSEPGPASAPSLQLTTTPPTAKELAITPDGTKLVVVGGFSGEFLNVLDLATGTARRAVFPGPGAVNTFASSVALSPDGRLAVVGVFSNTSGRMHLVDLETLTVLWTVPTGVRTRAVDFTPDGRLAVARSAVQLTSLDVVTGTTRAVSIAALGSGRSQAVFPDSRHVLVAGEEASNQAVAIDLESGRGVRFTLPAPVIFGNVLPNGREAILIEAGSAAAPGTRAFLLDLASGATEQLFVGSNPRGLAVSPDGLRAAVPAAGSSELALIDLRNRRVRRVRIGAQSLSSAVAFSPDGSLAAAFDEAGTGRGYLVDFVSLNVRQVAGAKAAGSQERWRVAFTPDGTRAFVMYGGQPYSRVVQVGTGAASTSVGIERAALPAAETGKTYTHRFRGQGGRPDYRFLPAGPVPGVPGLVLGSDGLLSGSPHESGLYSLEASVQDSAGTTAPFTVPLLVRESQAPQEPLTLFTRVLAVGQPGQAYRQDLAAIGGGRPYEFALAGGTLPEGLALSADGVLSGSPVRSTTATVSLRVRDTRGETAGRSVKLEVIRPVPFELPGTTVDLLAPANDVLALDLNRDGRDDLAVAHQSPTTNLSVLLAGEGGFFGPAAVVQVRDVEQPGTAAAGAVRELAQGDFDGNGMPDLAVRVFPGLGNALPTSARPAVVPLLGDGSGGFTLVPALDVKQILVSHTVGDVNGDALDDILEVCYANIPAQKIVPTIYVRVSTGGGGFSARGPFPTTSPLNLLQLPSLSDLTGDGLPDLVARAWTSPSVPEAVRVFRGTGDGGFEVTTSSLVFSARTTGSGRITALCAGDLDGDGRRDVLAIEKHELVVSLQTAPGVFSDATRLEVGPAPGLPVLDDFDGDSRTDVLVPLAGNAAQGNAGAGIAFLANIGAGRLDAPVCWAGSGTPTRVAVGDFDKDGVKDVAAIGGSAPVLRQFMGKAR